jgi:hypothetical protein
MVFDKSLAAPTRFHPVKRGIGMLIGLKQGFVALHLTRLGVVALHFAILDFIYTTLLREQLKNFTLLVQGRRKSLDLRNMQTIFVTIKGWQQDIFPSNWVTVALYEQKREIKTNRFDTGRLDYLDEFGLAIFGCPDEVFVYEIHIPEGLDANLVKQFVKTYHCPDRYAECRIELEKCMMYLLETASSSTTIAELQHTLQLLQRVEIKESNRMFPNVTQKGIDAIATFHEKICMKLKSCCDCKDRMASFSQKLAKATKKIEV